MADTSIDICNRALAQAGARSSITSLDDQTAEAEKCKLFYQSSLNFVLSKARWNFAQAQTAGIATTGAVIPQNWLYAYQFPADCVRMQSVIPVAAQATAVPIFGESLVCITGGGAGVPFVMGTSAGARVIFTNAPAVNLAYTAQIVDLGQWETQALMALEYALASRLAIPLSGDKTLAQGLAKQAMDTIASAQVADANEVTQVNDIPVDWLLTRSIFPPETAGFWPR